MSLRARRFCFTIFIRENRPSWSFDATTEEAKKVRRLVYQKEKCPETGRLHYQGYVELKSPQRMSFVKKLLERQDAHIETARGSAEQCYEYCTKEESRMEAPVEVGDWTEKAGQGRRSDLHELAEDAKNGLTFDQLVDKHPTIAIRAPHYLRNAISLRRPPRDWVMEIVVIWGDPGAGKSRLARDIARIGAPADETPYSRAIFTSSRDVWFEDYRFQHTVILDDYYGQLRFPEFLKLTDRYDYAVSVKGGYAPFLSRRIIFTSNQPPDNWHSAEYVNDEHERAFNRRISRIIHLTARKPYDGTNLGTFYPQPDGDGGVGQPADD